MTDFIDADCPDLRLLRSEHRHDSAAAHIRSCMSCRAIAVVDDAFARDAELSEACEEMTALAAVSSLAELTDIDRARLDAHLGECSGCLAGVTELCLDDDVAHAQPRVAAVSELPSRPRTQVWWVAAAAGLAVAAAVVLVVMRTPSDSRTVSVATQTAPGAGRLPPLPPPLPLPPPPPQGLRQSSGPVVVAPPSNVTEASDELEVVARLVEFQPQVHCGKFAVSVTMKYRVLKVIKGSYRHALLYVNHLCPELSRASALGAKAGMLTRFSAGQSHRMTLRRANPQWAGWSLGRASFDVYAAAMEPRYWSDRTDLDSSAPVGKRGKHAAASRTIIVKARAKSGTRAGERCGVLAIVETVEYRVEAVVAGAYAQPYVYGVQLCPSVTAGQLYRLELEPPNTLRGRDRMHYDNRAKHHYTGPLPRYWVARSTIAASGVASLKSSLTAPSSKTIMRAAEQFVAANGYTARRVTKTEGIVLESMERYVSRTARQILGLRHNTLQATAVCMIGTAKSGQVLFRYRDAQYRTKARGVRIRNGKPVRMEHQTMKLSACSGRR